MVHIFSEKSDVWSFGILMYEIIFSKLPFDGNKSFDKSISKITKFIYFKFLGNIEIAIQTSSRGEKLTAADNLRNDKEHSALIDLINRCLSFDKNSRPDFTEIKDNLQYLFNQYNFQQVLEV